MDTNKVSTTVTNDASNTPNMKLFWGCFIVLVASAFGFVFRAFLMPEWAVKFDLSKTQQGEIFGVSFWPFALSIVIFSLVIDNIGYKKSMIFAFLCHVASVVLTIFASGYWMLYFGTFLFALGNGAAEAVINPVVASMFPRDKTKWLNILHAGWPAGIAIAGVLGIGLLDLDVDWRIMMAFVFIPAITYGVFVIQEKFPVNERVKAGISYLEMLKEVGVLGALIITSLFVFEVGNLLGWSIYVNVIVVLAVVLGYGLIVKSWGKGLFVLMLLLMIPLATMELGTDSWITDLMTPEMAKLGFRGGWVLVLTAVVMAILRLYTGVVVKLLSPLAILAISALVAAVGLQFLSLATGTMILIAALLYALGKTYLWGTMLGVVSEQFPKGGALALNITSAVGQLGVGIIGAVFLGFIQDGEIEHQLMDLDEANNTSYYQELITETKTSIFGTYNSVNYENLHLYSDDAVQVLETVENQAKKSALSYVSYIPAGLFIIYLALILYFRRKGGYKPIDII